jgi:hypothetical protein
MLLRKGWGIFGPLPLGGSQNDLTVARSRIEKALSVSADWDISATKKSEEE